jgi:hypothetical protein
MGTKNKTDIEKLNEIIATMGEAILTLAAGISELKSAVNLLQVHAATQITPANPKAGIKVLQALQKKMVENDPHAQETKEARELIERLRQWKKSGGGPLGVS